MEIKDEKKQISVDAVMAGNYNYRDSTYHCHICNRNFFNGLKSRAGHINRNSYHKQQYQILADIYWQIRNTEINIILLNLKPESNDEINVKLNNKLSSLFKEFANNVAFPLSFDLEKKDLDRQISFLKTKDKYLHSHLFY